MSDFSLALGSYRENKGNRDNRLVRYTQGFLIFFLTTLTLTSASIQDYLKGNLEALLGSDMVVAQYQQLSAGELSDLRSYTTTVSETSVLPISLTYGDAWQRVQLKLVDENYPVQGELRKSLTVGGVSKPTRVAPGVGEIWVDTRVASQLGVSVGDTVKIADRALNVSAYILHEPDRLLEGHTVDMRALVSAASFADGQLPAEGMRYRYLIEADAVGRGSVTNWVRNTVPDAQLLDRHTGRHPLAAYWVRVENFLGLASVLLFFMAAIAINMAGRRQLEQQKHRLALYRSMGVPLSRGLRLSFTEWFVGFLVALVPAVAFAYGAQFMLMQELQAQFAGITPGVHFGSVMKTGVLAFTLLICTQVPTFIQLKNTSVVTLIRQQPQNGFALWQLVWGFLTLSVLAAVYSDNWLLTGMTLTAMGSALLLMMFVTWFALTIGERWGRKRTGILPFAFFMMKQRLFSKSTQVLGLGLCATLLLFTLMLMKDIGEAMHSQTRTQNGNLMVTDARDHQLGALEAWAKETGSEIKDMSSFTRALVIRINGQTLEEYSDQPSDTLARLERPIRLSWSEGVPSNNRVEDGTWWQANDANWQQVSVESEVMTDLGLSLGDVLTFDVAGKPFEFTVVASHVFQSGGSSITYWYRIPAAALPHLGASVHNMGSMELPETAWPELGRLLQQHPTLSVASLQELTDRFDKTLAIVTKATVGFSAMILLLSLIVIVASVSGFEADDKKRNGLLRSMGLKVEDCLKLTFYEWLVTGLVAAVGAVAGTWIAGQLIYSAQFSLTYEPDYVWITGTLSITCALVCAVGLYFCRDSLRASVRELMAE